MSTEKILIPNNFNDDYCNDITHADKPVLSEQDQKSSK